MFKVHGGSAAMNPGADFVQPLVQPPLAPEQSAGPVTAHRTIKLSFACAAHGAGQHRDSLGHTGAGWQIIRLYGTAEALLHSRITEL